MNSKAFRLAGREVGSARGNAVGAELASVGEHTIGTSALWELGDASVIIWSKHPSFRYAVWRSGGGVFFRASHITITFLFSGLPNGIPYKIFCVF